jgi:hypothetical protein
MYLIYFIFYKIVVLKKSSQVNKFCSSGEAKPTKFVAWSSQANEFFGWSSQANPTKLFALSSQAKSSQRFLFVWSSQVKPDKYLWLAELCLRQHQ